MSDAERVSLRTSRIGFWLKRLKQLRGEEQELKRIHPDVAMVLADKSLLLWKEMLSAVDYPDPNVFSEFAQGTPLLGDIEATGLWPTRFPITERELIDIAMRERSYLVSKGGHGIVDELSQQDQRVNSAVQCSESPRPHTVDVFAAMCVELMRKHVFVSGEAWLGRAFDRNSRIS